MQQLSAQRINGGGETAAGRDSLGNPAITPIPALTDDLAAILDVLMGASHWREHSWFLFSGPVPPRSQANRYCSFVRRCLAASIGSGTQDPSWKMEALTVKPTRQESRER